MQILSNYNYKSNTPKPTFKRKPSITLIKETKTVLEGDKTRKLFIKLSTLAGLSGIIAWTQHLIKKENKENITLLNDLNDKAKARANSYLINPNTMNSYLDINSSADTAIATAFSKGLATTSEPTEAKAVSEEAEDLLLNPNTGETFIEESLNEKLTSAINQSKAMAAGSNYEEVSRMLDERISGLVKTADILRSEEKSSGIYKTIAELAKMISISKILELLNDEEKVSSDSIENTSSKGINILENPMVEDIEPEEVNSTILKISEADTVNIAEEATIISKIEPEKETDDLKTYTVEELKSEIMDKRINDTTNKSLSETYDKFLPLICNAYNSIQKENLRETFMNLLTVQNRCDDLMQYVKFGGMNSKLGFVPYLFMLDFKRSQGLKLTLTDFRDLDNYKDKTLKYATCSNKKEPVVYLNFRNEADVAERFETAIAYFKALYSVKASDIVDAPRHTEINKVSVLKELSKKISKDSEEYKNILQYLGVILKPISGGQNLKEEDIPQLIEAQLSKNPTAQQKFEKIIEAAQNEKFDGFVQGVHGRMRFIERIVLEDKKAMTSDAESLNSFVSSKINKIKYEIKIKEPIILTKYATPPDEEHDSIKYSPQLKLGMHGKYILGLNRKGQIHTIYEAKGANKY